MAVAERVERTTAGHSRLWIDLYLSALFLAICGSGARLVHGTAVWTLADWLINYQGGFVRRGLPGQIAFDLGALLHVKLAVIVLGMGIACYLIIYLCTRCIAIRVHWNVWLVCAFISPVTLAFPFISTAGFHKEALFFACFTALLARLLWLRKHGARPSWIDSLWLGGAGVLGVLSHELFPIYAPYLLAAIYLALPDWRRVLRLVGPSALAMGVTLAFVIAHPGTPEIADKVCASLGPSSHAMCHGSIEYLGHTRDEARGDVIESAAEYHYPIVLPPLTLLGVLPLAAGFWSLRTSGLTAPMWWTMGGALLVSCLASVPLFLYAADWGRWIDLHLFSIFLLLLFAAALYPQREPQTMPTHRRSSLLSRVSAIALLALYATCWSLPPTTDTPKAGYISMFSRVLLRSAHLGRWTRSALEISSAQPGQI